MDKKEQSQTRRLPGFYIALCCCVIAIGIAGYFTEKTTNEQQTESILNSSSIGGSEENDAVAANEVVDNVNKDTQNEQETPILEYIPEESGTVAAATAVDAESEITEDASAEAVEETAVIVGTPSFSFPCGGDIVQEFSQELSYNSALGDWRTHNGVDIAIDSGGSVTAIADGTISEISSDEMGDFVVIEHDGGFASKYCGLSSVENLNVGDEITGDSVIGIVTESKAENTAEPHLHLEMYKDSALVNPSDYLS
ncbi:MAG: M23 family metallopeptidase [Firmicutes bacterium]|nr:M23 family metallopeptidase [Bacillota bacterium]